jgi:hypothetical protein
MAKAAEDELFSQRHDPSCAYELPEKWESEPKTYASVVEMLKDTCDDPTFVAEVEEAIAEPLHTKGQAVRDIRFHRTQDMHVLRASDGAAIAYFPVRADAEQRLLSDEFVDAVKATVTVR